MRSSVRALWFLVLFVAACAKPTELGENLALSVAVSRSVVAGGDTLSITVTAFNPSRSVIDLSPGEGCMPLDYRIYDSAGERLSPPVGLNCALVGSFPEGWHRVRPGERRQVTHKWSAIYNYNVAGASAQELPPGEYHIVGGIAQVPDLRNPSPPVAIQVIGP